MKKLMIAAAVVALAAVSQAAAITWNSDVIKLPSGSDAVKGDVTGYLFMLPDKAAYDAYASYLTDGKALSQKVWADFGTSLGDADANKTTGNAGTANMYVKDGADPKSYPAGTYYAAILYTTGEGDNMYFMGNVATAVVGGSSDVDVDNLSKVIGGGSTSAVGAVSTEWAQAVPEPTSGLLLLLGVAGLALRRRRA